MPARVLLTVLAQTSPALDEPAAPSGGYGWQIVRSLIVLALVCAAAVWAVRAMSRRNGVLPHVRARGRGRVQVIERIELDARRELYLVRVGPHAMLVGSSEQGLTVLKEMPASELGLPEASEPASASDGTETPGASLRAWIARWTGKRDTTPDE